MVVRSLKHFFAEGLLKSDALQIFSMAATRLPTTKIQQHDQDELLEFPVMTWPEAFLKQDKTSTQQELLILTWAVLLRAYDLSDIVNFELENSLSRKGPAQAWTVDCQWKEKHIAGNQATKYGPSVRLWKASELSSQRHLPNTSIVITKDKWTMQDHVDFMLVSRHNGHLGHLSLVVRAEKVAEKFAKAVGSTLRYIFSELAEGRLSNLTMPNISDADFECLRRFSGSALTQHQSCMHELVRKTTARYPQSEAVCAWDGTLTYRELDAYSDVIAKKLVLEGVKVGHYVPFAFEKSVWTVVSVLGILKAGGAFVALDPTQPIARLRSITDEVDARIMIVSAGLQTKFEALVDKVIVVSHDTAQMSSAQVAEAGTLLPVVQPEDIAFILFTSGSTGKPKGMVMQHRAYSTHTICLGRALGYEKARVLQFSAHTFDVYVMDVFTTLCFGGCICIPCENDRRLDVGKAFRDLRADFGFLTPSLAHVLDPSLLPNLRTLLVGGEALKEETLRKWRHNSQASIFQIYGPAEVGVCVLGNLSEPDTSPEVIGYPLDNSMCLVVDPENTDRLVAIGAVGEMVVAGPTMLREYLNNPDKTKACFIDNPAWADALSLPWRRFFRTGDLVRYNIKKMDGSFDFVGRRDSQVKYHGQRMELEDIEHHLSSIETISACMVSIPKEGALVGKLVAVVQLESSDQARIKNNEPIRAISNPELTIGHIRGHLAQRLPLYMIPNALLVVQRIPHTPSMKLNRPVINEWIRKLQDEVIADDLVRKSCCDVLSPDEHTARLISYEYARLVGGDSQRVRSAFEGHDFCLQAGGVDSIQIISLSDFVRKTWGVKLSMSLILSSWVRVRDIAAVIDEGSHADAVSHGTNNHSAERESVGLMEELLVDLRQHRVAAEVNNVLLTGATGFLGIEILRQLLQRGMTVFALVRGKNAKTAKQRLIDIGRAAGWWRDGLASKLEVWLGNLSQTNLGLDDVLQARIRGNCNHTDAVHAIVHNGAKVHYALDYASLKHVNVASTIALLKLTAAPSSAVTSFVYVSGGQHPSFTAARQLEDVPTDLGYSRSKLISELVVTNCSHHPEFAGKQLSVVKPGYIVGNADDGCANLSDFLWRLVASCIEVGAYDVDDADRWLFIADRSRTASTIIEQAVDPAKFISTVQILDGLRLIDLWQLLSREFLFDLQPLSNSEWFALVQEKVTEKGDSHVMFPVMHMLEKGDSVGSLGGPPTATAGVMDAIRANIRYLIRTGYLPKSGVMKCATPDSEAEALPMPN